MTAPDELEFVLGALDAVLWRAALHPFRFTYFSPQASSLLGVNVDAWRRDPRRWLEAVHPDDRPLTAEAADGSGFPAGARSVRYRLLRPDGRTVWIHDTVRPSGDGGLVGLMREAAPVQPSGPSAADSEVHRLLQGLWDNLREGVVVENAAGQILHANPAAGAMLGREPVELCGMDFIGEIMLPGYRDEARGNLRRLLSEPAAPDSAAGKPLRRDFRRSDGSVLRTELTYSRLDRYDPPRVAVFFKDVEERLRYRESLQAVFEASHDGIFITGMDGLVLDCNSRALELCGEDKIGAVGRALSALILAPAAREFMDRIYRDLSRGAGAGVLGQPLLRKLKRRGGRDFDGEIYLVPLQHQGRPAVAAFVRDRSEEERQLERIADEEARLRSILELSPYLTVLLDHAGRIRYASSNIREQLGWEPEALLGQRGQGRLHPEDRARVRAAALGLRQAGRHGRLLVRLGAGDGAWRSYELEMRAFQWRGRRPGLLLQARDLEPELAAKEALQRSESLHRGIVESSWDLLAVAGPDGRLLQTSPSLQAALGLGAADLLGRDLEALVVAEDRPQLGELLAAAAAGAADRDVELRLDLPRGPRHYEARVRPLSDDRSGRILFKARDIQHDRENRQRVLTLQRLAVFGQLAAGFAHEVRNPLAAISGAAQLARRRFEQGRDGREQLEVVIRQSGRLRTLIEDVLQNARSSRLMPVPTDPCEAMERALESARQQFGPGAAAVAVEQRCDFGGARVLATEERLQRLLHNLVLNALQAMTGSGARLRLLGACEGGWAHWRVEDNGPGLGLPDPERIFEPFFTTKPTGSGLGLWIAQNLCNEMDGKLRVEAVEPHGAAFILSLPLAE